MTPSPNLADCVLGAPAFGAARAGLLGGEVLAASDLAARAREVAAGLGHGGLGPDEPVVLHVSNAPEDLAGMLGIWLAGGVAVPVHVATPGAARDALIARLGSRHAVRGLALETAGPASPPERPLLRGAALVVFTSGSTGQPKGVVLGHRGLAWKLGVLGRLAALSPADTVVVPLQLTFIFGIWVSLLSLMSGARLLLAPKLLATGFGADAPAVSVLATVPTVLRALSAGDRIDLPRLGKVLTGGEPFGPELAASLAAQLPGAGVHDLYGLTETGSCDFCVLPGDQPGAWGTIGRPTEGVDYRIEELAALDLPPGVGELRIRSPSGMLGYLDDPEQTAAAFEDGYFRTGDLVSRRDDGLVRLVGRSKDIVSRGGNKIAPLEIETLFAQHGGVAAALAFGMPDPMLGERLHLMVVARDPALDAAGLRAWAAGRLEPFRTPDVFHFVESLPVGRTGKADRAVARASLGGGAG